MIRERIKHACLELSVGESTRECLCPYCGGGDTKEKSFPITRLPDGIIYNCYRAKCGKAGFIPSRGSSLDYVVPHKEKEFVPRPYEYKLEKLDENQIRFFRSSFSLVDKEIRDNGIKYSPEHSRYYFPLFNRRGYDVGGIARSYKKASPKSLTYWTHDGPRLHYPRTETNSETCVLVEDIVSGIRVARFLPAIVLLGTSLNKQQVAAIATDYKNVICALDPDATQVSITHKKRHGLSFRNFLIAPLSKKDPKDMTDKEIQEEIIQRGGEATCGIPTEPRSS